MLTDLRNTGFGQEKFNRLAPFVWLRNFLGSQLSPLIFEKTMKILAEDLDEVCRWHPGAS